MGGLTVLPLAYVRPRGKGHFASRINRYTHSFNISCFQLVQLVTCGSTCPNPGPDSTCAPTNAVNLGCKQRTQPTRKLCNIKIANLDIRSLKNRQHYTIAKEIVQVNNKLDSFTISETCLDDTVSDLAVEFTGFRIYHLSRRRRLCVCETGLQSRTSTWSACYYSIWSSHPLVENLDKKFKIVLDLYDL